jgi:hypothetical protein
MKNSKLTTEEIAKLTLSFLADLNGSEWIKQDSAGAIDMNNRAKVLQAMLYNSLKTKK